MKLQVFSVFDEKAQAFASPFFMHRKGEAIRAFEDVVNDSQSRINKHASDYSLYCLGEFDDHSGKISACPQPEFIAKATDFLGVPAAPAVIENGKHPEVVDVR